jgi:hypothetical protein
MSKEDWGSVRITVIEVEGPKDTLLDSIRAATGREVAQTRPIARPYVAEATQIQGTPTPLSLGAGTAPQALPPAEVTTTTAQTPASDGAGKKKATPKKKADSGQTQLKADRKAKLNEIIKAKVFPDHERYTAAIGKDGVCEGDLAALMTRLAQDKFGVEEGLSPAEVRLLLKERFFINVNKRTMEEAMKKAPSTFYATAPSDFDKRGKLYRPMKDCLIRVEELLSEFDHVKTDSAGTMRAEAAAG